MRLRGLQQLLDLAWLEQSLTLCRTRLPQRLRRWLVEFNAELGGTTRRAIKFGEGRPEDKPSQAVIDTMKEAGYRWNPADRIWAYPVRGDSAMSTRIEAERLYQEVRQMIRQEKGIETGQEVPF